MKFNFYFTGVDTKSEMFRYLVENYGYLLYSQLNDRRNIMNTIEYMKEHPDNRIKLFIDSGAYSAWSLGKKIDVEEYINFLNKYSEYFEMFACVDKLPGTPKTVSKLSHEEVEESAKLSWENYLYMRSKVKEPDKLLYTFHSNESFDHLITALQYEDEHGKLKRMATGGTASIERSDRKNFFDKVYKTLKEVPNEIKDIHAFGVSDFKLMENYTATSSDSTTWVRSASFGQIMINNKVYTVSDRKEDVGENEDQKSLSHYEALKTAVEKRGFTVQELKEDVNKRKLFNIIDTIQTVKSLQYKPQKTTKVDLF